MPDSMDETKARLLEAALPHVAFDGWTAETLRAACRDADVDPDTAEALFPRGAIDLALAFHDAGDAAMAAKLKTTQLVDMRVRDRINFAVRTRIEVIPDKEAVRRGTTLFALPQHASDGMKALWNTSDAIWTALKDPSEDLNWYTKRATLMGVYGSTVLYWLGDESLDAADTWAFLDRRIEDVMRIEKTKSMIRDHPVLKPLMAGPNWLISRVRAPARMPRTDVPGVWMPPEDNPA
ncbi:MAG: COQ9 family protein [Pseudomonadota bacterium]